MNALASKSGKGAPAPRKNIRTGNDAIFEFVVMKWYVQQQSVGMNVCGIETSLLGLINSVNTLYVLLRYTKKCLLSFSGWLLSHVICIMHIHICVILTFSLFRLVSPPV